jgi:F-type H+-transporting ATPase subunit alpha
MKSFEEYLAESGEIGFVEEISHAVAYISGLPSVSPHELIVFESGEIGYVLSLRSDYVEVLLFSKEVIKAGTRATRTKEFLKIHSSPELLGNAINPFGRPLDPSKTIDAKSTEHMDIDRPPDGIATRKRISKAFETGVGLVDLVLPLGKGQRELVIGDRKTGKTNFLMQTMLSQAKQGTICIYVGIGKKQLAIKKVEEFMKKHEIYDHCLIVASSAQDSSGIIYLTPYTGMAVAEYFKDQGKDVLIILDDLTTHAKYYREISLLIRRFPGRNSYPADVFYSHARLLERAGNFINGESENSITCLAVAETVQGDLSGYIQTNLMSMTDGHLYFDSDLFAKGRRPAVHPFLSVTRVGRQTQTPLRQTLNREILSFLSLFERMQNFTHFGAEVSDTVANTTKMGEKVMSFFEQLLYSVRSTELQMLLFSLMWVDTWRDKPTETMKEDMRKITDVYYKDEALQKEVIEIIAKCESFNQLLGEVRGKPDAFYKKLGLQ